MILLFFVLKHAGLCGILGDESLRPSILCNQLNKYSAYLDINHCHQHLSHEKYFHNTKKHFYLWVFSWGFKFWAIEAFRYHHCLSFLPKKKKNIGKKKKRKKKKTYIIINKSLVSYTFFMYFKRVKWLSKSYFDSSWLLLLWVGFGCDYLAIRLYYHWA